MKLFKKITGKKNLKEEEEIIQRALNFISCKRKE